MVSAGSDGVAITTVALFAPCTSIRAAADAQGVSIGAADANAGMTVILTADYAGHIKVFFKPMPSL
jgi:hypothetical protein